MSNETEMGTSPVVNPKKKEKRKVSHSETGHAVNVANFEDLEACCIGYGTLYNPSKKGIQLPAIAAKRTASVNILKTINDLSPALIRAVDEREIAFNSFEGLIRRINNAVEASDVTPQFIKDVKSITYKMLGERITPKHPTKEDNPNLSEEELIRNNSSAQTGMDNQIENLYKLNKLLSSEPNYNPNETDLTVVSLTTLYTTLKTTNTAVINADNPISNKRIERNVILYHPQTGLVKMASDIKKYIKSVFGVSSPQYKEVSRIKFKTGADLANIVK
jgi:hypothetical protein